VFGAGSRINRRELVRRHNPVNRKLDPKSPLSVGNGEFAFTADITGLQTVPDAYEKMMHPVAVGLALISEFRWARGGRSQARSL
jgi:hypothetical protein